MLVGEKFRAALRSRELVMGLVAVLLGAIFRGFMAKVMFLQADEEIFSYDAYYFILQRPMEFITGKIGAYIGYPFLLSIWFRVFGVSLTSARGFSVVCSVVLLIFAYLTLKKITGSVKPAFLGTLALALLPFPLRYGHVVLSEPLAWALISPGVFFLVKGSMKGRWYHFLISGLLFSSAFFVRRSALILLLAVFPALIWTNRDSVRSMMKEAMAFLGGFLLPLLMGIFGFMAYFGWDKLQDLRWTRVPHVTAEWSVDLSGISTYENALYTLQPTTWVGAGPVMLLLAGGAVLYASLFKDRWKAVYVAALLWPAMMRVSFDQQMSSLSLARIMVIPVIALFLNRTYKTRHGFYLSLSILFGSAVAFSFVFLSGDIWNVIIYCAVGGMTLVYLADRLQSRLLSLIPLFGGLICLYLISLKEPQIERLVLFILPVAGITYSLSLFVLKKVTGEVPMVLIGMAAPLLLLMDGPGVLQIASGVLIALFALLILFIRDRKRMWYVIRLLTPIPAFCFALFLNENAPAWSVYLPLLGMVIFMLSGYIRSRLIASFSHLVPVTGAIMAFILCLAATRDIVLSGFSGVFIGITSVVIANLDNLSSIWKQKVGEKLSVILLMLVIGYLAFYVYYAWTHIYMMEFLLQFALIGGLLIWVMRDTHMLSSMKRMAGGYRRYIRPVRIRRRSSAVLMALVVISVPFSVSAFLKDDWFREEGMDKRPYMRTIEEISDWIVENTEDDEKILAWHCYAVQADRECVIEVSNAAIYNGRLIIREMEEQGVDIFVRDWYTNHGLWENQPIFQDYILGNFVIDEVIDGNECWIRSSDTGWDAVL